MGEFRRQLDVGSPVALGFEANLTAEILVELLRHHLEVGAGQGLVQADQKVAGLNPVAVAHLQLAHDAAGGVLHLLDAGVDHELATGDDRAR